MKRFIFAIAFSGGLHFLVFAQEHRHHNMDTTGTEMAADTSMHMAHSNMDQMDHGARDHEMSMSHSFSENLPMSRNGSGTGWLPDASPMYGYMFHTPKWMYMLHGNLFGRYNDQDFSHRGSRGGSEFDAPDWLMFMGQRRVGRNGLFHFSTMVSLDAPIGGGNGYPLLFQSGESYKGSPIVDRQHPHDLFSEISVSYAQALSKKLDIFLYVGYPGEPALGPVAFMHRPSALDNPDAPLSHHWVDATHISFGVATLGIRYGRFKLEGSSFTGREPNDERYGFDRPRFDSWSGRLSFNPSENWAFQVSHGFLKSPEDLHPDENVHRTTASATYSLMMAGNSTFNAMAVWGLNKTTGQDAENAAMFEAEWRKRRLAIYTRYEWVQKSVEELTLSETVFGRGAVFPVNAITLGLNYDVLRISQTHVAAGAQLTYYAADARLDDLYGQHPMAFELFIRIYPGMMTAMK